MEDNHVHDVESDEFSDEDTSSFKNKSKSGEKSKPKKRRFTSKVWKDFDLNGKNSDGQETVKCKHCAGILVVEKNHGTSTMKRHTTGCKKRPRDGDVRQLLVGAEGKLASKRIDHSVVRELITLIIICHDLPFSFVEYPRVRELLKYLNPEYRTISRNTAVADVVKFHGLRKEKMKQELAGVGNRICLTCDVWRSISIEGYICLTAHYVDDSWKLQSKILSFCAMPPPHSGFELAKKVLSCLEDWGIEKKIFSLTLDNASSNDNMQSILKDQLSSRHGLLCDGEFFHIRCSAHILNLIVQDGLKFIENALQKIRETVKWIKWSEGRKDMFKECIKDVGLEFTAGLKMDVSTRWNSTYLMLGCAMKYRRAYSLLQRADKNYKYCPSDEEWNRAEKIHAFLEPFYDITKLFSGTSYPTANLYFAQIWKIECMLNSYSEDGDRDLKLMANEMRKKFDKYWEEYSTILAIGAILDPRMKLEILTYCFNTVDPSTSKAKIAVVKKKLYLLFDQYKSCTPSSTNVSSSRGTGFLAKTQTMGRLTAFSDFKAYEKRTIMEEGKSKLTVYLEDDRLELTFYEDMDVLEWWKSQTLRYGELARMACDVLSIPITSVASESAFSIGAHVLNKYRSRLLPRHVEALICTRTWLDGFTFRDPDLDGDEGLQGDEDLQGVEANSNLGSTS